MEMHQVRYFLAVCAELNFTRAAERCHVAQPSLTRAIKQLEDELGGALFHRERANTHLTELGRTLKPYLEQVLSRAEEAKREAQEFVRLQKTPLRLGLMCTIAPTYLLDLVAHVRTRHPGIELQIIDAAARQLQERLIAGALDVAIYAGLPADERLHYLALYREQFQIVLEPRHALAARRCRAGEGSRRPALSLARQLRDRARARRCDLRRAGGRRADRVPERARRLDPRPWRPPASATRSCRRFDRITLGVVTCRLIEPEIWREVALVTVRGRPHSPGVGAWCRRRCGSPGSASGRWRSNRRAIQRLRTARADAPLHLTPG